ncbi:RPA-related protein RADX-like isoform X2 [Montipora foliosa]|uniref:RPA-related protein RADX-like isoform X2 n=1 Tax=Montipora foliosa TaxID=591990 RepID=UPI0035F1755B
MMAEDLTQTAGFISRLKAIAGGVEAQETFQVRVLDIFRYIIDKSFPIVDPDFSDAFDILITDGLFKTKCLLSPTLNSLVYDNKLRKDSVVSITECSSLIDEESLEQSPCVILQGIEILDSALLDTQDRFEDIVFCENATPNEKQDLPLLGSRGYYLPLRNDEDFFGSKWYSDPDLKLVNPISNAITIADLDSFWKALPRPFPALIGRIVSKTRLNHYGKSSDKKRRYPYQVSLELEDRTATVTVCIWDYLCVLLYNYLQVGDIVAILNYRVSRKFGPRSNAVYNTCDAVNIEISVNPSNPVAEVYKLPEEELGPEWRLPDVPYRFISRRSLSNYPSGLIFDVVGTVVFVGREIRERKGSSTSFWTSKWVHLKDGTSSLPIILQLYASSQPAQFDSIAVGNILVGARMLLKIETLDSKHRRCCFFTTTRETQLYVIKKPSDANNKPFSGFGVIEESIKWRQSLEAKQLLRESCNSGYYDFPPLPHSLESYKRIFPPEKPMDLITTVNLGFVLKELHYRERVRLHIQATIVALEFVPFADSETSLQQTSGESSCSQLSEVHVDDEREQASSSACSGIQSSGKNSTTSSSQETRSRSSAESFESERKKLKENKTRRMETRSMKTLVENDSDSDDELTASIGKTKKASVKDPKRVLPSRRCKKAKHEADENVPPERKRKGKEKDIHLPRKAKKQAATRRPDTSLDETKKRKKLKSRQRSSKKRKEEISQTTEDNDRRISLNSTQPEKYFPFRIIDETWLQISVDTPYVGLWKPSCHDETFPRFCSQGPHEIRAVPSADRQGFVNSGGYWRLMLVGLNRRTIINAIFMPAGPQKTADLYGEPEDGAFMTALTTGAFAGWYPVEALLNRAEEELKGRRMVFVLDLYSHGEEKVEIVINRAY